MAGEVSGGGRKQNWKSQLKGNHNCNILYEKDLFSIKREREVLVGKRMKKGAKEDSRHEDFLCSLNMKN